MTIDELRVRKRELQARLKYERELQARGEGNDLDLFIAQEELNDVNEHLRALTVGLRHRGGVTTSIPNYRLEEKSRQQYLNWRREDTALDNEIDDHHARMRQAAVNGLDKLRPRQREMLEMYLSGTNIPTIAAELGVNRSTVSRNITRAKKSLQAETERALTEHKLLADSLTVDLRDPAAANAVFLALTPMQTVYFYLRYSEGMTFREIEALTSKNHSTVIRTIRRALYRIDKLLGGQAAVLEHPEILDELAYQAYCQLEDHPEMLPKGMPKFTPYSPKEIPKFITYSPQEEEKLRTYKDHIMPLHRISIQVKPAWRKGEEKQPGKLLSALLSRPGAEESHQVFRWLEKVFTAFLGRLRRPKRKVPRNRMGT